MLFNFNKFFFILIFLININHAISIEIKTLALVDSEIITNQDLNKEKIILRYLFNNKINEKNINNIALENLIEHNIKKLELSKNKIFISDLESVKFLNLVLKSYNKSIEDFRGKINNNLYENYLKDKVKIEMSWNRLISEKYSSLININLDEVIAKVSQNDNNREINIKDYNSQILLEKNLKLQSLSQTYFNEVKNKTLIKFK